MKKNILAVALVAGLGLAGGAAAYNYGTAAFGIASTTVDTSTTSPSGILVPENVAYQVLSAPNYDYTMTEDLVFDIQAPDDAVQYTSGFTVRVKLNRNACTPISLPPGAPVPMVDALCSDTLDGALFDTGNIPAAGTGAGQLELNAALVLAGWQVQFDAYYDGGRTASIRIIPAPGNNANPSPGEMLRWHNPQLTSLDDFADGTTTKVDAEFWMVNTMGTARFPGSTQDRTILARISGVAACATDEGAEKDKYIDVADSWLSQIMPKSRFSWDGKLGSATNPGGYNESWIDLGDVTITGNAGGFAFLGTDQFTTVISGGAADDWFAFDNDHLSGPDYYNDDVFLYSGSCASGTVVAQGEVNGNTVTFNYTATAALLPTSAAPSTTYLTVCGFVDSDTVIDDHLNHVTTTFYRADAISTAPFNDSHPDDVCDLLPLRYNGSTMEIFTINPGSNATQRSFIRLTNRSATDGHVSLVGIDDLGREGASQVRVWIPAGQSVQLNASDLEDGTNGAVGGWGAMGTFPTAGAHKWRAVVTAEFPGLVVSSMINAASSGTTVSNITDTDTRGEQYMRDGIEGTLASLPGTRPSDIAQESTPDFRGNGETTGEPGGPNDDDGPTGGTTDPCGNPGFGSGNATDSGHDNSNEDPYCYGGP